jgi:clan AA aspartic protease
MIGVVTAGREAIIRLRLQAFDGSEIEMEAVLDTGFTEYLSLPQSVVSALNLSFLFTDDVILADGSIVSKDLYEGELTWDGRQRTVVVHCMEGSPLIGMSLLYDPLLTMEVIDGGPVSIVTIP